MRIRISARAVYLYGLQNGPIKTLGRQLVHGYISKELCGSITQEREVYKALVTLSSLRVGRDNHRLIRWRDREFRILETVDPGTIPDDGIEIEVGSPPINQGLYRKLAGEQAAANPSAPRLLVNPFVILLGQTFVVQMAAAQLEHQTALGHAQAELAWQRLQFEQSLADQRSEFEARLAVQRQEADDELLEAAVREEALSAQLQTANAERESAIGERDAANAHAQGLQRQLDTIAQAQHVELERLRGEIARVTRDLGKAMDRNERIETELDQERRKTPQPNASRDTRLAGLEAENLRLTGTATSLQRTKRQLDEQITQLQEQITQLQDQLRETQEAFRQEEAALERSLDREDGQDQIITALRGAWEVHREIMPSCGCPVIHMFPVRHRLFFDPNGGSPHKQVTILEAGSAITGVPSPASLAPQPLAVRQQQPRPAGKKKRR